MRGRARYDQGPTRLTWLVKRLDVNVKHPSRNFSSQVQLQIYLYEVLVRMFPHKLAPELFSELAELGLLYASQYLYFSFGATRVLDAALDVYQQALDVYRSAPDETRSASTHS